MENTLDIENGKLKTRKLWNIAFYILSISPILFIISLLTFYIHAGVILGYGSISGINPYDFSFQKIYQFIIIYSWVGTFFSFLIWLIILVIYFIKNKNEVAWKLITITLALFAVAWILVFSKIFQFALD